MSEFALNLQNLHLIYIILLIFLTGQSLPARISSGYWMGTPVSGRTYGTIASWIFPQICLPAMTMVSCVVSSIKQPAGSHWWRQTECQWTCIMGITQINYILLLYKCKKGDLKTSKDNMQFPHGLPAKPLSQEGL